MASAPESESDLNQPARFREAVRRFNEENARDPNRELDAGQPVPREQLYAKRLAEWVLKLCPEASEELRLASHCQHLCRWMIPRGQYEMNRAGYLRWRNELKKFHADKAGQILREVGYTEEIIARVRALNLKQNFPQDPESRVLEDALCLMFLEHQCADLARRTSEEKMINALQKSWKKMTPSAQAFARQLALGPREQALIDRALASLPST
jgi:hypothetical protein